MILGGGVAVCLLLSVHRAVIFAIAQLSCYESIFLLLLLLEFNSIGPMCPTLFPSILRYLSSIIFHILPILHTLKVTLCHTKVTKKFDDKLHHFNHPQHNREIDRMTDKITRPIAYIILCKVCKMLPDKY